MIVESHWRLIKHDFLHRFNRPRIDLVVWVLLGRVAPPTVNRMNAIMSRNHRFGIVHWRKGSKAEWNKLSTSNEEIDVNIHMYHTNPVAWTCGCPCFLLSQFLLRKHIVRCFKPITGRVSFFDNVKRHRVAPFWTNQHLVLKEGLQGKNDNIVITVDDIVEDREFAEAEDFEDREQDDDDKRPKRNPVDVMARFGHLLQSQYDAGNTRLVDGVSRLIEPNIGRLLDDIESLLNQRQMSRATMPTSCLQGQLTNVRWAKPSIAR